MRWLKQLVLENWWLKLLSLVMAYSLWAIVAQAPPVEVGVWAPLELRHLPENLQVSGEIPARIHLHLRGSESQLRQLRDEMGEVGVVVDLSGAVAGDQVIVLNEGNVERPPGIEVVRILPDEVHLALVPR